VEIARRIRFICSDLRDGACGFDVDPLPFKRPLRILQALRIVASADDADTRVACALLVVGIVKDRNTGEREIAAASRKLAESPAASRAPRRKPYIENDLAQALFCKQAGIDARHIGYKGTGPAVMAIVSGEIQFGMPNLVGALPQIRAGKLRAYGTATAARTPFAPEIPTLAEGGVPGVEAGTWYGINAPRGTRQAVVAQLNGAIVGILETPAFQEQFATLGVVAEPSTPQEFGAFIRSEIEKWGGVMKFAGLKQETY